MRLQKEHAMQLEARMTEIKREKEAAEAKLRGYGADDGAADWRERTIQRSLPLSLSLSRALSLSLSHWHWHARSSSASLSLSVACTHSQRQPRLACHTAPSRTPAPKR
eukprot:640669-Rhodomonas_salina.2